MHFYVRILFFSFSFVERHHIFVTCDSPRLNEIGNNEATSDYSCLRGEGICMKQVIEKPLLRTKDGSEHHSSKEMKEYELFLGSFSIGCSCQIIKGSFLENSFF